MSNISYKSALVVIALFMGTSCLAETKVMTNNNQKLTPVCEKMLKEANKLVIEAEKQPGTHPQVKALKDSLTEAKKDLQKLDSEMQTKSCEKSLDGLNKLKESQDP